MTDRQQKKVDGMETNEEKVYTVSQAAMEKIVRTAVAGTTGVAANRKIHVSSASYGAGCKRYDRPR